ncbi:MAG TPA: MBL fold metallo-hydrolase RNA specificity domain-containing protein, partial [Gammaproteobacteria bacterium]|nr:MBL fold metallo-hydrolase RNA specificity domain-containing protein [Gammaproteobacteria bacterium]
EVLSGARAERGNILIPAFAVGRTQGLLYTFYQSFDAWGLDDWQVFLDSPMAIEATEVYARHTRLYNARARDFGKAHGGNPFELPNLHLSRRAEDSMRLNRIQSGAVIIAGSGMCTGGRIKHHLKHHIWREHTHLMIVGFQAAGTLGRALVDGARRIRLWGETIRVAGQVHTIGGLSAHADRRGLLEWYGHFEGGPHLALTHGEPGAREALAEAVKDELGTAPWTPDYGDRIDLIDWRRHPLAG